jgi:hypothetical protein
MRIIASRLACSVHLQQDLNIYSNNSKQCEVLIAAFVKIMFTSTHGFQMIEDNHKMIPEDNHKIIVRELENNHKTSRIVIEYNRDY